MASLSPSSIDRVLKPGVKPRLGDMMRKLLPYVWPSTRADLRMRIYGAFALMLVGKLITVAVPYAFKWATDAVTGTAQGHGTHALFGLLLGPLTLTVLYGFLRIVMSLAT